MDALERFEYFLDDTDLTNYSFDPTAGKGFDAVRNPTHAKTLQMMFSNGSDPLYIIAITNKMGGMEDLEAAYGQVVDIGMGWCNDTGWDKAVI